MVSVLVLWRDNQLWQQRPKAQPIETNHQGNHRNRNKTRQRRYLGKSDWRTSRSTRLSMGTVECRTNARMIYLLEVGWPTSNVATRPANYQIVGRQNPGGLRGTPANTTKQEFGFHLGCEKEMVNASIECSNGPLRGKRLDRVATEISNQFLPNKHAHRDVSFFNSSCIRH